MRYFFLGILFSFFQCIQAQFLEQQKDLKSFEGYFRFYYQESKDKIYLEVDKLDQDFLYIHSLATGLGSNDIGLDRGQIGDGVVVRFEKAGNKLLLVQPNLRYRTETSNVLEARSVKQAFAKSVLFGFTIKEKKGNNYIIDLTPFLMQDRHQVIQRLQQKNEGNYKVDVSRSALAMEQTKAFPKNVEFEALLTYTGNPQGKLVETVAPEPTSFSLIQHHSFVALPDSGYQKRVFDPRSGALSISYMDYATPVQEPIVKRFILRHRLEKKDPKATISEAKEPIIYYLDPGTPEPVRSALLDGARWWNQAFEAIGYKDAFQVKMLPKDADPMDVRYNVIQWVHRSTRGWSYGASVVDPRTGEILKGHVSLGSLRIRQDFLIAQALLNRPFKDSDNANDPMLQMALARIRQLSAHEVGHTLGFAHNFAASTNNRTSVMDYPHPLVSLKNGVVNLENAYDDKIGDWDKVTVAYSYSHFESKEAEPQGLHTILDNAYAAGHRFITDADARPRGGAHPLAHLWDNGTDVANELERVLAIRKQAIQNFSEDNIRSHEPYSVLEDVFVPLYFFHRYQTEATVKLIGGQAYNYAVKGDQQQITKTVEVEQQKKALQAILMTLKADVVAIPEDKLRLFPPRAFGYPRTRESFRSKTGVTFDPMGAAATASDMTLGLLLHPERLNRLLLQKSLNKKQLAVEDVLNNLTQTIIKPKTTSRYQKELMWLVADRYIEHLKQLYRSDDAYSQVKGFVYKELQRIKSIYADKMNSAEIYQIEEIESFFENPAQVKIIKTPKIPDGSPIGSDYCSFAAHKQ